MIWIVIVHDGAVGLGTADWDTVTNNGWWARQQYDSIKLRDPMGYKELVVIEKTGQYHQIAFDSGLTKGIPS